MISWSDPILAILANEDEDMEFVSKNVPIHSNPDRFYIQASELLDDVNIVRKHPLNSEQMFGSPQVGHRGVSNLPDEYLIKFGGPKGNDPVTGSRFFQPDDDLTAHGSGIRIESGHHRLEVIRQRLEAGQISPDTLIEVLRKQEEQ